MTGSVLVIEDIKTKDLFLLSGNSQSSEPKRQYEFTLEVTKLNTLIEGLMLFRGWYFTHPTIIKAIEILP